MVCTVKSRPIIGFVAAYGEERAFLEGPARILEAVDATLFFLGHTPTDRAVETYLECLEGIILGGGVDDIDPSWFDEPACPHLGTTDRKRDEFELMLVRGALARGLPLLGLCRGAHILNVACGGTLVQDIPSHLNNQTLSPTINHLGEWRGVDVHSRTPNEHAVSVAPDSKLFKLVSAKELKVNSYHHQAIARLGRHLRVSATSQDGVIEAIEATNLPFAVGVQWHPELMMSDTRQMALFQGFRDHAASYGAMAYIP